MTEKELRRLSRAELLEMLIRQVRETEELQEQLNTVNALLQDREIKINRAGSIAEAALKLNGVFSAAQDAAAQYLENIQRFSAQQKEICARIEADAREKAEAMLRTTEEQCAAREKEADEYWGKLSEKLEAFYADHKGLFELLEIGRRNMRHETQE